MAERLPDDVREQIAAAIRAGGTCRGIATEHEVSPGTVRNIAKAYGLTGAFARTSTENATRARVADLAARRARLAERLIELAERMATRATEAYTVLVATKDEVFRETLDEPPAADTRQFATALGIYVDKHIALVRFDTREGGNAAATSLADRLIAALTLGPDTGDVDDGYPPDEDPLAPELDESAAP